LIGLIRVYVFRLLGPVSIASYVWRCGCLEFSPPPNSKQQLMQGATLIGQSAQYRHKT